MWAGSRYAVDAVFDGAGAVGACALGRYDVILMDCQMPELDGYETTRRVRALPLKRQPRIVAMTANAMRGESEKCLEAGMDDYMSKPVRLDMLREMLARWAPPGK
jgi:CheY-like chemotaxis protein